MPINLEKVAAIVTSCFSWARDGVIVYGVFKAVWGISASWQHGKQFLGDIRSHMTKMEGFAFRVEHNHMKHMERYLYQMAKDRNITSVMDSDLVAEITEPVIPPDEDGHDASSF